MMIYEWQKARDLESKHERISKNNIREGDKEPKPF